MAAKEMKEYKLKRGFHRYPNPKFDPHAKPGTPEATAESHIVARAGDKVPLSATQYAAFADKFEPNESEASEERDRYEKKLEAAKALAEELHESVDPNVVKPIDSPSTDERYYQGTDAGRAGMFPKALPKDRQEGESASEQAERERAEREQEMRGGVPGVRPEA